MKIQIEILNKETDTRGNEIFVVDGKLTEELNLKSTKEDNIQDAKTLMDQLLPTLTINQKIRIIEYHNDDPDLSRTPCKILFEA